METQIFYWTGAVAWWCVMGCTMLIMITMAIFLPCYLFIKTRRAVWHWIWAAKIAKYGFTRHDLNSIYAGSKTDFLPEGVELKDLVNWAGEIMERAEKQQVDY